MTGVQTCALPISFFETLRFVIIVGIHATGVVKFVSLSTGIIYTLNPFIIFLLFKMNLSPAYAYTSIIFVNIILSILAMLILKHNEPRINLKKIVLTISLIIAILMFVMLILYFIGQYKTGKYFFDIIIIGSISSLLIIILGFYCILNKSQQHQVIGMIKNKLTIN